MGEGLRRAGSLPADLEAPAKLTLSLRITGVRPDGYHLIDAEMVSVDLADRLELAPGDGLAVVGGAGSSVPLGPDNLVRRALQAAGRRASVRLHKRIPAGAGLGGGSADAAAVLRWAGVLDVNVAVRLGADVPFCLFGGRARVEGVGEVLSPLPFAVVDGQAYTLLTPPMAVSTAAVYRAWDDLGGPTGPGGNDLEPAALAVEPALAIWRDRLGDATGETPRLAGSGGTWFVPGSFPGAGRLVVRATAPSGRRRPEGRRPEAGRP
ncbi:MAG TPA: 4-(cytidine 5'-diphospho)-2-C-methyl-D-erythritol kinase [Acidimicrobiales bacterium]|nr:4-(cytidine 5'-diphospho)-2-C-methyl-D-erythritol kinase [Acidimicrobiales bacterium]